MFGDRSLSTCYTKFHNSILMKIKTFLTYYISIVLSTIFGSLLLQIFSGSRLNRGADPEGLFGSIVKYIAIEPQIHLWQLSIALLIFILTLPMVWALLFWKQREFFSFVIFITAGLVMLTIISISALWFGDMEWSDVIAFMLLLGTLTALVLESLIISIFLKIKSKKISKR